MKRKTDLKCLNICVYLSKKPIIFFQYKLYYMIHLRGYMAEKMVSLWNKDRNKWKALAESRRPSGSLNLHIIFEVQEEMACDLTVSFTPVKYHTVDGLYNPKFGKTGSTYPQILNVGRSISKMTTLNHFLQVQ